MTAEELNLKDGEYTAEVTMEGGSGRATIDSPTDISVKDGKVTAEIKWSSSHYDYMLVDGEKFLPVNTEGNSVFEIPVAELRQITEIFTSQYDEYPLDPTYEPDKHEADVKDVNKEHEAIFATLQRFVKLNLVIPVEEEHMYYAAIHHKSCKLTAQGQHYWQLVNKNTI